MFDPQIVRRDMDRIFARATREVPLEGPSNVKIFSIRETPPPAAQPGPERRAGVRRKIFGVCLAVLALPALAIGVSYAIDAFKHSAPPNQTVSTIATRSAAKPKSAPVPHATPPSSTPAAFMVLDQKALPQRAFPARRRWNWARYRASPAAEYDADAIRTRQLNRDSLASTHPTLGYFPGVAERRPPR